MLHFQNYLSIIIPLKILKSPNPHTLPSAMVNSGKRRLSVNAKKSGLSPSPKSVMKNKNIRGLRTMNLNHATINIYGEKQQRYNVAHTQEVQPTTSPKT